MNCRAIAANCRECLAAFVFCIITLARPLSAVRQGIVAFWCGIINLIPASLLNLQEKAAAALFFFSRVQYSAAAAAVAAAATGRHHHQPFFIAAAVAFYFISIPLARPILLICICRALALTHSVRCCCVLLIISHHHSVD